MTAPMMRETRRLVTGTALAPFLIIGAVTFFPQHGPDEAEARRACRTHLEDSHDKLLDSRFEIQSGTSADPTDVEMARCCAAARGDGELFVRGEHYLYDVELETGETSAYALFPQRCP